MRPYLIGIAGPSCSGKSEVSRRLARILRARVVAIDHYYKDLGHLTIAQRNKSNVDAPESVDRELVLKHVEALRSGHAIEQPTYDFTHHTRAIVVERIEPSEYVLIEGLFALSWLEVRDCLDFRTFISVDHQTCLTRRIFRDVR